MSTKEKYIFDMLEVEYEKVDTLRQTDEILISSYKHKHSSNKLIVISSKNQNDTVFKMLKGQQTVNMPMILDVCCGDERTIILEQFINGENLADLMVNTTLTKEASIRYCLDICNALEYLHNRRIVHRDIKPLNVIVDEGDRAVLIDLQTARIISDEKEKDTRNLGTVGYAAPEQYGIFQSLPATDIYALGVMLNELMIGKHPSVEMPNGSLGKIIEKCTDINISKRYQNVEELSKDLKKILKHKRKLRK